MSTSFRLTPHLVGQLSVVHQDELQRFNDYCETLASTPLRGKTVVQKLPLRVGNLLLASQ
jgi:hypothetical protein